MHLLLFFMALCVFVFSVCATVQDQQQQQQQLQIRPCSFTDEINGFYASWHTNCSGLVNFVINAYNFPRPKVPPQPIGANGFFGFSPFPHFWIGIGFRLVSTEIIMVENQPNTGGVMISQARIDDTNRPPQRQIGHGILLNPRGSFVGTILEATFSIDESLLKGCKEFLFFTTPIPVDVPSAGLYPPHVREVCELGRMCSTAPCSPVGGTFSGAGPVGMMDYIGTGGPQDPTLPMTLMNDIGSMNNPSMLNGYGNKFMPTGYGGGYNYNTNAMMFDAGGANSRLNGGRFGLGPYNAGGYGSGAAAFSPYGSTYRNGYYGGGASLPYPMYWPQQSPALQYPMMGGGGTQLPYYSSAVQQQNPYSTAYWGGFLSPLQQKAAKKTVAAKKRMLLE